MNNCSGDLASQKDKTTIYFGVHVPSDCQTDNTDPVFENKDDALRFAKKFKKARFKPFQFYHEAAEFALHGYECFNNSHNGDQSPLKTATEQPSLSVGEKPSPFRGPKPQDLVKLRKGIEIGDYEHVKRLIWENPRYLVSSGDTPSILQEGFRYNALHVAAKTKNHEIADLILSTVSDTSFIKLLYGDDNEKEAQIRSKILVDLYLNTPDKGLNETPLHFAVKFGAVDVVEVFLSYPQCDKTLKNKYGKTPDMIVCERDLTALACIRKKIAFLLEGSYYVPVYRAEDNCMAPIIGEPFTPVSPPVLNNDPLSPRIEIHAYAGPMDKKGAEKFRRAWKTPPRTCNSPNLKKSSPCNNSFDSIYSLKYKDPDKGLERLGKSLANKYEICWKEFWPFLNSFIDITSEEGLNLLEKHLSSSLEKFHSPPLLTGKSTQSTKSSHSMSDLCLMFQDFSLNDTLNISGFSIENNSCNITAELKNLNPHLCVEKSCNIFSNRICTDIEQIIFNNITTAIMILEKNIKQFELLIISYMEDCRFTKMNFQLVHSRLGTLISQKLKGTLDEETLKLVFEKLKSIIENCENNSDYSDDGHPKDVDVIRHTSYKRQLVCVLDYILNSKDPIGLNVSIESEEECAKVWDKAKECECLLNPKKIRKTFGSFRNHNKKFNLFMKLQSDNISKKLCFDYDDDHEEADILTSEDSNRCDLKDDDDSEDEFFTPPSSPSKISPEESDSEEDFDDAEVTKEDIFIEGINTYILLHLSFTSYVKISEANRSLKNADGTFVFGAKTSDHLCKCDKLSDTPFLLSRAVKFPTKSDRTVYNALKYAECKITPTDYPFIYRWYHAISLYSEEERKSWQPINQSPDKDILDSPKSSTPNKQYNSWTRITGVHSPRSSRK